MATIEEACLALKIDASSIEADARRARDALDGITTSAATAAVRCVGTLRIGEAARAAGMAERNLYEKMKQHGLSRDDYR